MRAMRWIAMLAVLTATSAFNAFAQDITTSGTKPVGVGGAAIPGRPTLIGGLASDTTRWALPITSDGQALTNREQNPVPSLYSVASFGIDAQSIAAKGYMRGTTPINMQSGGTSSYSLMNLMVTTAVADSDSAAFLVFLYAKQTPNAADGIDMLIPSRMNQAVSTADTASTGIGSFIQGWYIGCDRYFKDTIPYMAVRVVNKTPGVVYQSNFGNGQPIAEARPNSYILTPAVNYRAQYYNVLVINLSNTTAHTLTVNAFLKAN